MRVVVAALLAACRAPAQDAPPPQPEASPAARAEPRIADAARDAADAAPLTLAADLARRTRDAEAVFGPHTRSRTVGDVFLLTGPPALAGLFDQAASLLARALPRLLDGRFSRRPEAAVTVMLFASGAAYERYLAAHYPRGAEGNYGLYDPAARVIVEDGSGGASFLPTLTHEIVHPLLKTDFPDAPLWLSEAVASLYEAPEFSADGGIHGVARNWRHARLSAALASRTERDLVRLDAFFPMDGLTFLAWSPDAGANTSLHLLRCAMARAVAAWLDSLGKLWPFYHAWRDGFDADPTGARAFATVMGRTPAEASAAWLSWVR